MKGRNAIDRGLGAVTLDRCIPGMPPGRPGFGTESEIRAAATALLRGRPGAASEGRGETSKRIPDL